MRKISLSRKDLLDWVEKSNYFFNLDLSRISTVLLGQIHYFDTARVFAGYEITDEIKYLEGKWRVTTTRDPDMFRHEPLKGLYKKHFTSGRFIQKNITNNITGRGGNERLNNILEQVSQIYDPNENSEVFINALSYELTIETYMNKTRSKSVTGEWIVFHKYGDVNYYLTLGSHKESNTDIYARAVLACEIDRYPFRL